VPQGRALPATTLAIVLAYFERVRRRLFFPCGVKSRELAQSSRELMREEATALAISSVMAERIWRRARI